MLVGVVDPLVDDYADFSDMLDVAFFLCDLKKRARGPTDVVFKEIKESHCGWNDRVVNHKK